MLAILYILYMGQKTQVDNRVRIRRAELELTQSGLAALVGCTRQTVAFIEKVEFIPSVGLALKLADALRIPINKLFWLTDKGTTS